jgi:eukaryotic-like serine/threonine-protein kinase
VIRSAVTATACHRCGAQNDASAHYCANCGAEIAHSLPPTERQPPAQRSGTTVPPAPRLPTVAPPRERHAADPLIGRIIADRYRVLELIGRGGMGVVYRAEHARIGKILALKLLTGELTRDAGQVARFKREALMASKLSHPNTVQVFDFGDADGLAYLAMEYVRGTDLGSVVSAAGQLDHERAARIIVQVCSSLAEAHDKGIVHRDLKPENIMIVQGQSGEDVAKVLDFGLAKLRESSELSDVTSSGAIVGTPYYMSPEQIRGEAIGPASDVYALGAVLYACVTGTVVFDAPTPMGVLTRHITEQPQPPSLRTPTANVPKGLERIILKALAKDPAQRFAGAAALQEALLAELRGVGGASSLELLLDSKKLRSMAAGDAEAATRDEVERYERKLHRRDLALWGVLAAAVIAAGVGGTRLYLSLTARPVFQGFELEPNNAASEALAVPFPLDVKGRLGQRIDKARGDRDFYRVSVPSGTDAVSLSFEPLPNLGTCLWLYPPGSQEPFGRYCLGGPGVGLDADALKLGPGDWVVAVMQDREGYFEGGAAPVHENVSDDYRLVMRPARTAPEHETEPNDAPPLGNPVAPGGVLRAALGWARDVDLVCAAPGAERVRFVVEDAIERPRSHYSVLQVTMRGGPDNGIPVRVHRAGAKIQASPRDATGAWKSVPVTFDTAVPPCVELTLVPNPWGPTPAALVAPPGDEEYLVRVERL